MLVCASKYILFLVWASKKEKYCVRILAEQSSKMFHRTFQSSIALLGMGKKEVKKGLKENIMTFESKELIPVKMTLFDSNPVRLIITKPNIQNLVESNLFHGNAQLLVF